MCLKMAVRMDGRCGGEKMSHRKRDAGDEMLGRTDSRWMNRKPFKQRAVVQPLERWWLGEHGEENAFVSSKCLEGQTGDSHRRAE